MSYQLSEANGQGDEDPAALVARISAFAPTGGHRTLAEKAFGTLHHAVVTGQLSPGERLPIEELAEGLGMSPMPIREALRRLDAVGLVENLPHRGARVRELSLEDLSEVYDARLALEIPAIRGAATNFTEANEQKAADVLDRHARALRRGDSAESLRTHTEFHLVLYEAAGSRWLMRLISPLWESAERYRVATIGRRRDYMKSRMDEHTRILAACRQHQPEVAEVELWNHLALTANAVAQEMGGSALYETR
jgi:DNA-binding GntR family transcriptional regulator